MAERSIFIDETYLKENASLSGNVDIAELYPYTIIAQDILIQEAIGTSLYLDLQSKISADEDLSGYPNEKILVKKIRSVILWYTIYKALPFLSIKLRNIGVVKQTGENLTSAENQEVKDLRHECKINGDFYLKRVQEYLCEFGNLFPEYEAEVDDEMTPNNQSPTPSCDIAF